MAIGQPIDIKLLPFMGALVVHQAGNLLVEIEHPENGKLRQRPLEDAPRIGDRHGTFNQCGKEQVLDPGGK